LIQPVTLVFDIGKTTKKALVFDHEFNVLEENTTTIPEGKDDDGFPCENLQGVSTWFTEMVERYFSHSTYNVTHVNFSAYGASLVPINELNQVNSPFYNYLKPCPSATQDRFFSSYVNETFFEDTASPWLGFLNSGVQAFWLKHFKGDFERFSTLLHLPQYFRFLLTGERFNEMTSIGCHTLLWNFKRNSYHDWTVKEGLTKFFPPISSTTSAHEAFLFGKKTKIGIGVHDSSAALMPYLVSRKEPFLLLSTGTWNICFNPSNHQPLTEEELKKDCLSYMTFEGKPVKASRIFLGNEHETQQELLSQHFNVNADFYKSVKFNESVYFDLKNSDPRDKKFEPVSMEGTGPLPEKALKKTNYNSFKDFEEAQHRLMIDLVSWQKLSIDLVDPGIKVKDVILVGGFSKSSLFLEVLKKEIPERRFYLSDHPRASALGAALLVQGPASYPQGSELLKIVPL
jgi:L-fuculokinase